MKKNSIIIFCLVAIVALMVVNNAVMKKSKTTEVPATPDVLFAQSHPYCFTRLQQATADAPYMVQEDLVLTRVRDQILGTKSGIQEGPGMSNGYEGTFQGALSEGGFTGVFAYTVEGASQSEKEIYELTNTTLTKLRYQLREEKGILVPIETGTPLRIEYTSTPCIQG